MKSCAPIAVFCYNRLDKLINLINSMKKGIRLALFAEKLDSNKNVLHRDKYIFGEAF
jgi:hypothetical protein